MLEITLRGFAEPAKGVRSDSRGTETSGSRDPAGSVTRQNNTELRVGHCLEGCVSPPISGSLGKIVGEYGIHKVGVASSSPTDAAQS